MVYRCCYSSAFLVFLEQVAQSFDALLNGLRLRDFVEGLVLLEDVVLAFVVDVHVGSLHVGKTCRVLVSGGGCEWMFETYLRASSAGSARRRE